MKNSYYAKLDDEMFRRYSLTKCINTGTLRRNCPFTIFSLILVVLAVYMVKNELSNYPLDNSETWKIMIASYILIIPLHEIMHFVPAKIMGYKPKLGLFHNTLNEAIKREDFIIFTLSPMIFITSLLIVLMFIFTSYIPLIMLLIGTHLISCSGDISQYTLVRKFNKNCYIGTLNGKEYGGYM